MSHSKHARVKIDSRVDRHMTPQVVGVERDTSLADTEKLLEGRGISSVLVYDAGQPCGVVSRTDLLRSARRDSAGHGAPLAPMPSTAVGALCKRAPITVDVSATVSQAASLMVAERVHRVFVEHNEKIVGVFSTKDLLRAIVAARVPLKVHEVMSHPLFTIRFDATITHATDRLSDAHVSGLTVVDEEGWPIGYYGQSEALLARDRPGDTPVEDAMNYALVCLHENAELRRAATLAVSARARRVLIVTDRKPIGVLTPLDFVRAVSVK